MRKNSTVIIAPQYPEVMNIANYHADTINCKIFNYAKDYDFTVDDDNFVYIDIAAKDMIYFNMPNLRLLGIQDYIVIEKKQLKVGFWLEKRFFQKKIFLIRSICILQ